MSYILFRRKQDLKVIQKGLFGVKTEGSHSAFVPIGTEFECRFYLGRNAMWLPTVGKVVRGSPKDFIRAVKDIKSGKRT